MIPEIDGRRVDPVPTLTDVAQRQLDQVSRRGAPEGERVKPFRPFSLDLATEDMAGVDGDAIPADPAQTPAILTVRRRRQAQRKDEEEQVSAQRGNKMNDRSGPTKELRLPSASDLVRDGHLCPV